MPDVNPPVEAARPAASVLLLRDGDRGLEVFTLLRAASMAFAPGMTAFPGGAVDPQDHADQPELAWVGPDRAWWRTQLGTELGAELAVAAVRELFEEIGVLLAGPGASGPAAVVDDRLEEARIDIAGHRRGLHAVLADRGLQLRTDLLRPWANWVTPEGLGRRYDTYFFVAALPAGQQARLLTSEAETALWGRPADLLEDHRAGRIRMLTPTIALLTELTEAGSVAQAMTRDRTIRPVQPVVLSSPGEPLRVSVDGVEVYVGTGSPPGSRIRPPREES